MGHFNSQYIANCDAHTSDDDHYDRIDYGRTNSLESARDYARSGGELGEMKNRYAPAPEAKSPAARARDLIDQMDAAKLTGNRQRFDEARIALMALVSDL